MPQRSFEFSLYPKPPKPAAAVNPLPARASDPASSKEAAVELIESGKMAGQRMAVFAALKRAGPSTSLELAQASGIDRHIAAKRLPELERLGLVIRGPLRLCKVGNRNATEWRAV